MFKLYEFLTGPALWAAFAIFIAGLIVRVTYFYALSKECGKVLQGEGEMKPAIRSTIRPLIEYGPRLRSQPLFSITSFLFYVCLFGIPLFLLAHNTLWEEAFSVSLPSLPGSFADTLTVVFLILALVLAGRRIISAEVRNTSTALDYSLVVLTIAPFFTGFLAYHQIGPYKLNLILHIIFAEMLLIVIPFSKLSHIALFFRRK